MRKNYFKNWFCGKSAGETLLEVIVALLVISMGAATAASLIITSIQANVFNKDSLIASNLAQEGLEYMRNLRDSNWMTYSADTEHCWNMAPGGAACATDKLVAEANSSGSSNPKQGYSLGANLSDAIATKLDLSDGISDNEAGYLISYWDTDQNFDSDKNKNNTDDKDIMASEPMLGATNVAATKYYRSVEVQYYYLDSTLNPTQTSDPTLADTMVVISRVQWQDGATTHEIKMSSSLSRYK